MNEMHGSGSKIPSKNLVRQRCAEGFHSGVEGLIECAQFCIPAPFITLNGVAVHEHVFHLLTQLYVQVCRVQL
jgi:hypothetical protein